MHQLEFFVGTPESPLPQTKPKPRTPRKPADRHAFEQFVLPLVHASIRAEDGGDLFEEDTLLLSIASDMPTGPPPVEGQDAEEHFELSWADVVEMHTGMIVWMIQRLFDKRCSAQSRESVWRWFWEPLVTRKEMARRPFSFQACCFACEADPEDARGLILYDLRQMGIAEKHIKKGVTQ